MNSNLVIFDQRVTINLLKIYKFLLNQREKGKKSILCFGGTSGLCSSLYKETSDIFSLGKMVWPHLLARVMVAGRFTVHHQLCLAIPITRFKIVIKRKSNDIKKKDQTILCILDGWGISKRVKGNAIKLARTPNFDNLVNNCRMPL